MGRTTATKVNKLLLSSRDDVDETTWGDHVAATTGGNGGGGCDDMVVTRAADGWSKQRRSGGRTTTIMTGCAGDTGDRQRTTAGRPGTRARMRTTSCREHKGGSRGATR